MFLVYGYGGFLLVLLGIGIVFGLWCDGFDCEGGLLWIGFSCCWWVGDDDCWVKWINGRILLY